jgi:hypothetical protein
LKETRLQPRGTHPLLEPRSRAVRAARVSSSASSHLAHVRQHTREAEEEEEMRSQGGGLPPSRAVVSWRREEAPRSRRPHHTSHRLAMS